MEENYLNEEIDGVIAELKVFFSLEGLRNGFDLSYMASDSQSLEVSHQYLEEIERFLHDGHEINIPALLDMNPLFDQLDKGQMLSASELYNIADLLSCSEYLYDLLAEKKEYYHLNDDALDLNPVTALKRDLTVSIEPDLTVSDQASAALGEVRTLKRSLTKRLSNIMSTYKNKYSSYLSNDVITFKAGEEALPVKASNKGFIKGTVVSYSASGETAFMVPYEVLDLRNRLDAVLQKEGEEIIKVLSDLSSKAGKQLKYLKRDYEIIFTFDRYLGATRYGLSYRGCISTLSKNELSFSSLFHPLLKAKKVVTNSLSLGDKNPLALLITGPNAGGKSVFIKAVSLAVYMDKLGLFVPCLTEAKIPFIDAVYFLGGDNQSVLDNLSTFSSHIMGIKGITEKATKSSLVVIDEVGEGTSPKDGEALGVALLKFFENVGCYTLLTSHFDGLKIYAASDENALTGAMEFNNDNLTPTYRLLLHTTGKSYGILLAQKLGIKDSIIKDAIEFENQRQNQNTDSLMEKLTEQESQNEKRARELEGLKKDLEKVIDKREKAIKALDEERANIHVKADDKIQKLVDKRIEEINKVWESKNTNTTYSEVSKVKGKLNKIKAETNSVSDDNKNLSLPLLVLKAGDIVEDEDGRRGTVIEVKKKEVTIDLDGLRFKRSIVGLKKGKKTVADIKKKSPASDFTYLKLGPSQGIECNVIGLYADDAMRKVVSFLDNARVRKFSMVRIIHGTGGFILKNAVWKYLSNHREFVKDYRLGGEGEGGLGATIVHLR